MKTIKLKTIIINNLFGHICYINVILYLKGDYSIYDEATVFELSKDTEEPHNEIMYNFKVKGIHYD